MSKVALKCRGREITDEDLRLIRGLIAADPCASRHALSVRLARAWNWRQANGVLKDAVCRSVMLALHRAELIELPPPRIRAVNNAILHRRGRRQSNEPGLFANLDRSDLSCDLSSLRPLEIRQVRRTSDEWLFDSLIEEHHYLGYTRPVGEHLKLLILSRSRPLACLAWSSAPRHLAPRDRFIGWSPAARRANVHLLAYNTRFLIAPWVHVPHLASHVLALVARQLSAEWERLYSHPIYYLETFVDPARYAGTCYRAANWISLGLTTGRGHNAQTWSTDQPKKEVLGYPLDPRFRELLGRLP